MPKPLCRALEAGCNSLSVELGGTVRRPRGASSARSLPPAVARKPNRVVSSMPTQGRARRVPRAHSHRTNEQPLRRCMPAAPRQLHRRKSTSPQEPLTFARRLLSSYCETVWRNRFEFGCTLHPPGPCRTHKVTDSLRLSLPRSRHLPLAPTDGSLTRNFNEIGVRRWANPPSSGAY